MRMHELLSDSEDEHPVPAFFSFTRAEVEPYRLRARNEAELRTAHWWQILEDKEPVLVELPGKYLAPPALYVDTSSRNVRKTGAQS